MGIILWFPLKKKIFKSNVMHYSDGNFYGMHFIWWIFWVAIVIWFIVASTRKKGGEKKETPLDILQKRYAKGEISREEYQEARKDLLK